MYIPEIFFVLNCIFKCVFAVYIQIVNVDAIFGFLNSKHGSNYMHLSFLRDVFYVKVIFEVLKHSLTEKNTPKFNLRIYISCKETSNFWNENRLQEKIWLNGEQQNKIGNKRR